MYIVFNGLNSGLGNNGGSRTILLSVNILRSLGIRCDIATNCDNFTWFSHKTPIRYLPEDADMVINIAAVDYEVTKRCKIKRKFAWWRGHEGWVNSEDYLKYCYTDNEVLNLVNSKGLEYRLKHQYGASSLVVYQGYDENTWFDLNNRSNNKTVIGCLFHKKETKKFEDFQKLIKLLGKKDYFFMAYGTDKYMGNDLDFYIKSPSKNELLDFYNKCHVWFAPTISEGLHNPPIEAGLCGCKLVCNDNINNGMILDYANNNTALIYKEGDLGMASELIRQHTFLLDNTSLSLYIKNNIRTRECNMLSLIALGV